jgi:2-dehydro-3-deoxyphosphogluconate aldolase/(4S)-4-hydroxy-2-oxoglutarate aldolase
MESLKSKDVFGAIGNERIVATVVIDNIESALPLAETFLNSGMRCIELTLRTDSAIEAIKRIVTAFPELLVGAGTVLNTDQLIQVRDAGAAFAVAPGFNPEIVTKAMEIGLPFAPGVCTPSDIERALECGCKVLKFFPAEPLGGLKYLKSVVAPYNHMGIRFIPLGGITYDNFRNYLNEDFILAIGGSWLAPRNMITEGNWQGIKRNCDAAISSLVVRSRKIVSVPSISGFTKIKKGKPFVVQEE